jgi:hypothetical protein
MKLKKRIERDITIKASENDGFIVEVGCVKLSYSDHHEMCRDLADYLSNPEKYEKAYKPLRGIPLNPTWGGSPFEGGYGQAWGAGFGATQPARNPGDWRRY